MDEDLLTLLHSNKIFSSVPKRAIRKILPKFDKVELTQNETLYYQGDPSDSIEILISGLLSSILTTAIGEKKNVGEILPGEAVGELGALSGEPRTTTVKADKNSTLFRLPSDVFIELCRQYPSVLFAIINPIVARSQKLIELISSEKFKKQIAFIPANEKVDMTQFIDKFSEQVEGYPNIILFNGYGPDFSDTTHEKIQLVFDDHRAKNIKKVKQRFIYFLKPDENALTHFCFGKVEMIYVVGNSSSPVELAPYVRERLVIAKKASKLKPDLVLLHDEAVVLPKGTANWLALAEFGLHHHIRTYENKDYRRLIRFIRNKAIGLVLGGGGTRGWAHAGVIQALLEAGIPIDAVGGSSVGAVIAASYASTESGEETLDHFRKIMEKSRNTVSWRNLTWPAISLFSAKGITQIIEKLFGDIQIEDLWLPYFCISTNLAQNAETVHTRGLLWEKVRASISIPGVIPPMLINGELHFDGGLLNNLPVDVMRQIVGHRGNVIAVELGANLKDEHRYDFPPILTFWSTLAAKLKFAHPDYYFPRFIDTFLRSLLTGSSLRAQQNGLAASILIVLDMTGFPMLHSNKKRERRLVEIGYESTIDKIKNLNVRLK